MIPAFSPQATHPGAAAGGDKRPQSFDMNSPQVLAKAVLQRAGGVHHHLDPLQDGGPAGLVGAPEFGLPPFDVGEPAPGPVQVPSGADDLRAPRPQQPDRFAADQPIAAYDQDAHGPIPPPRPSESGGRPRTAARSASRR